MVCSFDGTVAYLSFTEKELGVTFDRPKLLAALERLYTPNCPTLAQLTCLGLRHALPLPSPLRPAPPPPPKPEPKVNGVASARDLPNASAAPVSTVSDARASDGSLLPSASAASGPLSAQTQTAAIGAPVAGPSVQQEVRLPNGKRRIIPKFVAPLDDTAGTTPFQSSAVPSAEVLPLIAAAATSSGASGGVTSSIQSPSVQSASASTSNQLVSSTAASSIPAKPPGASAATSSITSAAAASLDVDSSPLVPFSRQASTRKRMRVEDDELDAGADPMPLAEAAPTLLPFEHQLPPSLPPQPDPFSFLPADFTSTPFLASQPAYLLPGIIQYMCSYICTFTYRFNVVYST